MRQVLQVRLACSVLIVRGCIIASGQHSGSEIHLPSLASSILLGSLYKYIELNKDRKIDYNKSLKVGFHVGVCYARASDYIMRLVSQPPFHYDSSVIISNYSEHV